VLASFAGAGCCMGLGRTIAVPSVQCAGLATCRRRVEVAIAAQARPMSSAPGVGPQRVVNEHHGGSPLTVLLLRASGGGPAGGPTTPPVS